MGLASLPELVERLQSGGLDATAEFSQEELESVIDDLPLALESEAIREALPAIVARIESRQERTFRRMIEIARQDEERTPLLLSALRALVWSGTPTEDEFAWLITQMTKHPLPVARMDAFLRAGSLTLHQAQVAILDAMAQIHPDEAIRRALDARHEKGEGEDAPETTGEMVLATERRASEDDIAPPPEESIDWSEQKKPDRLTARTLLRGLDPPMNLAGEKPPGTEPEPDAPPPATEDVSGYEVTPPPPPEEPASLADELEPKPAESLADELEPREEEDERTQPEPEAPPAEEPAMAADGGDAASAGDVGGAQAPADGQLPPDEIPPDRVTVRTLLRSLDTVRVEVPPIIPPEEAAQPPAPPQVVDVADPNADAEERADPVKNMLRSLDTVRLSLKELEATGVPAPATPEPAAELSPKRPDKPSEGPWNELDLVNQSPPERARRLAKVRRTLETAELRRGYLQWLFKNEDDPTVGPSVRKELLEYAFERPTFLTWDGATRGRLGRWIREKAAAELIPCAAVLAALRRAAWVDGEPPHFDNDTRPLVDAASGCLARSASEERLKLLGRDFSVWLFGVREFEDKEVLDLWAADATPGLAEGLFRALAAMDALAARVGGTGEGPTALSLAVGIWDRAHSDARLEMAKAIAAGWSKSFVLDRASFFAAFWKRHQEHESQREAIMIVLSTTFEKELDTARKKEAGLPTTAREPSGEKPAAKSAEPPSPPPAVAKPAVMPPPPPAQAPEEAPDMSGTPAPEKPLPDQKAVSTSPFAEQAEPSGEDSTARYFRAKREEIERSMRAKNAAAPAPTPQAAPAPQAAPVEDKTPPPEKPAIKVTVDAEDDDAFAEDEITADIIPGEGEDTFDEEGLDDEEKQTRRRARTDPKIRLPQKPAPPPGPETEVVLPHEPLRTLADYTTFLRSLSAGTPIDELLERHGMDYRQYAACMTAWGKVLQNRPELALRMGQLLRTSA